MIHDGSKIMMLFFAFAIIVPALYRNWIGVVVAIGVMFAMILGMFLRSIMTKPLFEKILTLICVLSLTGTSCAISEKFIIPLFDKTYYSHRASAAFFYPNYFGTIIGTVIIICAYKVLTRQGRKWFYYMIAGFNVVSMYLCESMFAWVEVFLGVAVLLVVLKMHRLLAIWLFTATVALFSIFVLNLDIIPRLSDAEVTTMMRLQIWQLALKQIIKSPLIGPGFMSFLYVYKDSKLGFLAPHAHSIYLDLLMNFGIIGTILFLWYFVCYYKSVIKIGIVEKKTSITSLIIAVTIVALVHGIIDVTLLWIQTLPLFLIILSGIGAYEKDIKTSNK
jgi:Lipid A core - O-antigen ligase and related enzymes